MRTSDVFRKRQRRAVSGYLFVFLASAMSLCVSGEESMSPSEGESSRLAGGTDKLNLAGGDELLLFTDIPAIEIFSASKKEEALMKTPAAVYVVTSEDIRRSGATSVMEALRMVPGVFVGRCSSDGWAISTRGFARLYATNLLVLVDGRSIYTPLFAGVHWSIEYMSLDTIKRIEVIRGPGSTLWGANAVNGVINIITKKAKDTQGWYLSGGAGSEIIGQGTVRYGGKLNDHTYFRIFSEYQNRDHYGDVIRDPSYAGYGGFRIDSDLTEDDSLTVMGEIKDGMYIYPGKFLSVTETPMTISKDTNLTFPSRYVLGRWHHTYSSTSSMDLQLYYDRESHNCVMGGDIRDTYDLDFQHSFQLADQHQLIWGLGYRHVRMEWPMQVPVGYFSPYDLVHKNQRTHLYSGFVQDEISLVEDRLKLIVGSKFEYNDYTHFEYQPSGRLVWTPDGKHTVWGAVSRAVRTPSWADREGIISSVFDAGGVPGWFSLRGNESVRSESMIAYELGYRTQARDDVFLDFSTYYQIYDHETDAVSGPVTTETTPSVYVNMPTYFTNDKYGYTLGLEASANWDVTQDWRLSGGYSYITIWQHTVNPSTRFFFNSEGSTPHNQVSLRSYLNLPHDFELDTMVYYVDNLSEEATPHYIRLDVRVGWKPTENIELSLAGYNLLEPQHKEYNSADEVADVPRSLFGQVTIRF